MPRPRTPPKPSRYFNSSPEVIRLVVMMYVRFRLSMRHVEDLSFESGMSPCDKATGADPALERTAGRECWDPSRPSC